MNASNDAGGRAALVAACMLVLAVAPADAQLVGGKCAAAKKACVTKKVKALLDCHAAADKKGGASQSEQVQVSATNGSGAALDYFLLVGTGGLDPIEFDLLVTIAD